MKFVVADGEFELLIEERVRLVTVYLRLPFPRIHFRAERQLHVRIVESSLITSSQIVSLDQVYMQIRSIKVVFESQMQPAQALSISEIRANTKARVTSYRGRISSSLNPSMVTSLRTEYRTRMYISKVDSIWQINIREYNS